MTKTDRTSDDVLASAFGREAILERWRGKITAGSALVGLGVDSGFAAIAGDHAGADFMVVNNTGKFHRAGFGLVASLMPYDDANATVLSMAGEILPQVARTPVFAGLWGADPFRISRPLLKNAARAGYSGIQNFPSVGFIDGRFRKQIERCGLGYELESEMIRLAHELGMVTVPFVFTSEEAMEMARAGSDALIFHHGLAAPDEPPPDPADSAAEFIAAVAPAFAMRSNLILLHQAFGSEYDREFLEIVRDELPCHGLFYDYAIEWDGLGDEVRKSAKNV